MGDEESQTDMLQGIWCKIDDAVAFDSAAGLKAKSMIGDGFGTVFLLCCSASIEVFHNQEKGLTIH